MCICWPEVYLGVEFFACIVYVLYIVVSRKFMSVSLISYLTVIDKW